LSQLNEKGRFDYPIFGYGEETVYIYYYHTYKLYAELKNLDYWPCKIGYTVKPTLERIAAQNSAMPESLTIPFIIKSEWARELETLLHLVLYDKTDREWPDWKFGDGGTDWFLTNPEEIRSEAIKYGQMGKGAKKILEEYNSIRTNWSTERFLAAKQEFPEIEKPRPFHLLRTVKTAGKQVKSKSKK